MAVTVEDVARSVAGIVAIDIDVLMIGQWVADRAQELANAATLRRLRKVGELVIPATESTGTVTVNRGEKSVSGSGTAFTQDMVERHFRASEAWYEIGQVISATELRLKSDFSEDSVSAGSYTIAARRHKLESNARKLGLFVHMRTRRPLDTIDLPMLDRFVPSRFTANSIPAWVAEVEPTEDNIRRVEIYPFSDKTEIIHYIYWAEMPKLGFKSVVPGWFDIEALREGVLIDVYRNQMAQAAAAGRVDVAGFWRNEARAQETRWLRDHRPRLLGQDPGADDLEFVLQSGRHGHPLGHHDGHITNAWDQIWFT